MNWMQPSFPMAASPTTPQMQNLRRIGGRWQEIGSYQEMQSLPLPFDGTPLLFMLTNEPVIYMASMQNGQRCVSGFRLEPLGVDSTQQAVETVIPTTEKRLAALESQMQKLFEALQKESAKNEPNPTPNPAVLPPATTPPPG